MTGSPVYLAGLDLPWRRVLVAGAGQVATRRLPALIGAGADIHVVSPMATPMIRDWAETGILHLVAAARHRVTPPGSEGVVLDAAPSSRCSVLGWRACLSTSPREPWPSSPAGPATPTS